MKLKAKIKNKYLKEILEGGKKVEYRQIESITLVDEDGNEHEFGVIDVRVLRPSEKNLLKKTYPDVEWKDNLPTIGILLGKRLNKAVSKDEKKKIYNPKTGKYYRIREKTTSKGRKGQIMGVWHPPRGVRTIKKHPKSGNISKMKIRRIVREGVNHNG